MAWYARLRPRGAPRGRPRGATSTVLHGLANAILSLGVPRVREWLQGRFGPGADVREIRLDGPLVRIAHATVPLGPRVRLEIGSAAVEIVRGVLAGRPEIELHTLEGALVAGGDGARFEAPISFRRDAEGARGDAWARGTLAVRGARWTVAGGCGEQAPLEGDIHVRVGETDWAFDRGALRAGRATVRVAAGGDLEGDGALRHAMLEIEDARAGHFLDALESLTGRGLAPRVPLPPDLSLSGTVAHDAAVSQLALRLRTARSDASLEARVTAAGDLEVATLRGTLAAADMPRAWLTEISRFVDLGDAAVQVDARAHGTVTAPEIEATLAAAALPIRAAGQKRFLPPLRLRDVSGSLTAGPGGAEARLAAYLEGGGRARLSAALRRGSPPDHDVTFHVEDAGPAWASLAARAMGSATTPPLPADARADLDVHATGGEISGILRARTPRSRLVLAWQILEGALEGDLSGDLAFEDARTVGIFSGPVTPVGDGAMSSERLHMVARRGGLVSLRGMLRAATMRVEGEGAPAPALDLSDVEARVAVDTEAVVLHEARAGCHGGRIDLHGRIPLGDAPAGTSLVHVQFARIGPGALASMLLRDVPLPDDAAIDGELDLRAGGSVRAQIALSSPRGTSAVVDLSLEREGSAIWLTGSRALGRVATEDAAALLDVAVRPRPGDIVSFEASVSGSLDAVVVRGHASAARVHVAAPAYPRCPVFLVEDVSVRFRIDPARLVWHRLRARVAGGVVTSSGVAIGDGLTAAFLCAGVEIGEIPLTPGARRLGEHARGRLEGQLRLDRRGGAAPIEGRGSLRIAGPDYPVLRRVESRLRPFGLPSPATRGTDPLSCRIVIAGASFHLGEISARTASAALRGDLRAGFDGSLHGDLDVTICGPYLAESPLLFVPASLVDGLRLPVSIAGTVDDPRVDADLAGALGVLLRDNAVSRVVAGAAHEIWDTLGGTPPPSPAPAQHHRGRDREGARDAFDLLLAGDSRGADLLDAMLDGEDPPDGKTRPG